MNKLVRQVSILGSGIMGCQIAAHIATAGFNVVLFDLASDIENRNKIVKNAINKLRKINPQPFGSTESLDRIVPANYDDNLELLKTSDIIIEAISEKLEWKEDLYKLITPHIDSDTIIATNTSGISLKKLMASIPAQFQKKFLGIHFFNPPRYLPLVEIILHDKISTPTVNYIETFLTQSLGKQVIRAKDTPNFIGNRIGVFCMVAIMNYAHKYNIDFDIVDQITGRLIGHPKSATFRTADLVGLDTLVYVMKNILEFASNDPWYSLYEIPLWLTGLIDDGKLGQKTKCGIYKKVDSEIHVLDIKNNTYIPSKGQLSTEIQDILKEKNIRKRFQLLKESSHHEAKFLYSVYMSSFHYAAYHCEYICDSVSDIDLSLKCGFGWDDGLFETWQEIGWKDISNWMVEFNQSKDNILQVEIPRWVNKIDYVYDSQNRSYSPSRKQYISRSNLPVYDRQYYPINLMKHKIASEHIVYEDDGVIAYTLDDNVIILSFKTKLGAIGSDVLNGIVSVIKLAESNAYDGIVIYQKDHDHFSVGANLEEFGMAYMLDGIHAVREIIADFQSTMLKIRYSTVPIVAAVKGYALGGGCELAMHCDAAVAALDSYIGLVEVGVGLVPAGGGCKEMVLRAQSSIDYEKTLHNYYRNIAMGEVAKSSQEAIKMGYLKESDTVIMNIREILFVAKEKVKFMKASNYRPPLKRKIRSLGIDSKATIDMLLTNMRVGEYISDYDYTIASKIARIMTGGGIDKGELLTEEWYLHLEVESFVSLADNQKTQDRIQYMLMNGKPLRN